MNIALLVSILIVCVALPLGVMGWLWLKEPSGWAASIGLSAVVVFAVVLICWAIGASWQTALGIIILFGFVALLQWARDRMFDAIYRQRETRRK